MNDRGFTIVEVLVAIIVLTIGLLGLMGTGALTTRMIARGQRSALASIHAGERMEVLRASACISRAAGSETLYRGGTVVGRNDWTWATAGANLFRLTLASRYKTTQGRQRSDTMELTISCVR